MITEPHCVCVLCVCVCFISVQCDQAAARSPAVFAAVISYVRDVLDVFGIDLLHNKVRNIQIYSTIRLCSCPRE